MNMEGFDIVFVVAHAKGRGFLPLGFLNGEEVYRGEYKVDIQAAWDRCVEETARREREAK